MRRSNTWKINIIILPTRIRWFVRKFETCWVNIFSKAATILFDTAVIYTILTSGPVGLADWGSGFITWVEWRGYFRAISISICFSIFGFRLFDLMMGLMAIFCSIRFSISTSIFSYLCPYCVPSLLSFISILWALGMSFSIFSGLMANFTIFIYLVVLGLHELITISFHLFVQLKEKEAFD